MSKEQAPLSLAKQIGTAFAMLIGAQSRAMVVERQPGVEGADDDLLAAAENAQRRLREQASLLLSELVPAAIGSGLAPADRVVNLARAVDTALPPGGGLLAAENAAKLAKFLRSLADSAREAGARSAEMAGDLDRWSGESSDVVKRLDTAERDVIDAFKGGSGKIAALQGRIAKTRGEIDAAIDAIITSSTAIGQQVSDLGTSALTYLSASRKPDKKVKGESKPEEDSEDEDKGETEAERKKRREQLEKLAKEEGGKAVQTIKATAKSAKDLGGAHAALNRANDDLADLYLALSARKRELAWARAMSDQGRSLAKSAASAAIAFQALSERWSGMARELERHADALEKDRDLGRLRAAWSRFSSDERGPLQDRLPAIRSALTSATSFLAI